MDSNNLVVPELRLPILPRCSLKSVLLCLALMLFYNIASAQLLNDINSLIEQIGTLETYKDLCSKGYKIVEDGVQAYKMIKGAEYGLHTTYFSSLKIVSPQVAGYLNQSGALTMAESTVVDLAHLAAATGSSAVLSSGDKQYIGSVIGSLQLEAQKDVDMINLILSSGQTSMSDGERISRLKPIIKAIEDQHRTAEAFIDRTDLLIFTRTNEQGAVETIESFY